ncbi:DUF58 domain-containing protein [Gryllotalpicola protaetiae]|uniref:DUF58 domain-containing protein n=1 Tax=Gryllotalpicola protaetiae TaxID=2419771 RepID=A0A387BLS9_9MICO|nr:DUF58 domain-containing protein [Gryllotalpicola protaetiae]AYG02159.1 DUF58 domain-containing protein [Gryllotalpicola protaetiae]
MAVQSRPMPTLRGWFVGACGVALLGSAGWFGRVDLLFAGLLLTIAPLAAMIAVALDRPWLTVIRTYSPGAVAAGEQVQVRLDVRNVSARATSAMWWVDELPAGFAGPSARMLASLAARGGAGGAHGADAVTLRYTARTRRRGAYLLGPLRVIRTDPFGLARGGYLVGDSKMLLVTPRVSLLGRSSADEARGEGTDPELVRHSIPSTDEVIPREYRPGDALRRVQWRATARLDRLMVRQEEQLSNPEAWLLLDTLREHAGDDLAFERAVELAASVASHLLGLGYLVGVHETGGRQLSGSYELPGGDQLLVGQLAGVEQTRGSGGDVTGRLAVALRAGRAAAPTFLLLVDGDPGLWAELAPLRRYASPAIAFLMTPAARTAREQLERSGWVCVDTDAKTDAATAWSLAMAAQLHASRRLAGARDA